MRHLLAVLVCGVAAAALVASASGRTTTTYHGMFTSSVSYSGCTGVQPPAKVASGTWNVALHGGTDATLTVNIFTNGSHHVSFGAPVPQIAADSGETFALQLETLAGTLVVRLAGTSFTYTVSPYDAFGVSCERVTYYGTTS